MAKIYLKPGMVDSRHDNQSHYVGLNDLYSLYKLTRKDAEPWAPWLRIGKDDVVLRPDYHGEYTLPEKAIKILEARNGAS